MTLIYITHTFQLLTFYLFSDTFFELCLTFKNLFHFFNGVSFCSPWTASNSLSMLEPFTVTKNRFAAALSNITNQGSEKNWCLQEVNYSLQRLPKKQLPIFSSAMTHSQCCMSSCNKCAGGSFPSSCSQHAMGMREREEREKERTREYSQVDFDVSAFSFWKACDQQLIIIFSCALFDLSVCLFDSSVGPHFNKRRINHLCVFLT